VARPGPRPAEDAVTAAIGDAAELLVILMEERPRMARHVADRRGGHAIGVPESAEAAPDEDPVDGRRRPAEQWSERSGP
jgi:hypothetical protein